MIAGYDPPIPVVEITEGENENDDLPADPSSEPPTLNLPYDRHSGTSLWRPVDSQLKE